MEESAIVAGLKVGMVVHGVFTRPGLLGAAVAAMVALSGFTVASAGTAWTVQPTPLPQGVSNGTLYGVSCASASSCVAAGGAIVAHRGQYVEMWNGSAWRVHVTPLPAGGLSGYLYAVSCFSSADCTAVGTYAPGSGMLLTLAEHWNGRLWAVEPTPNPPGSNDVRLTGVSCATAARCMAVGTNGSAAVTELWNGTHWTIEPTPATGSQSVLAGVSCVSPVSCVAVGSTSTPLAEYWNGSTWAIQSAPDPGGATQAQLTAVSCASAASCTAVGSYFNSASVLVPLAEHWDGSAWVVQQVPGPTDVTNSGLAGVSCPTATSCTAVGEFNTTSGGDVQHALGEYWNGSSWKVQETAQPTAHKILLAISCRYSHSCAAVGADVAPGGGRNDLPLAEQR